MYFETYKAAERGPPLGEGLPGYGCHWFSEKLKEERRKKKKEEKRRKKKKEERKKKKEKKEEERRKKERSYGVRRKNVAARIKKLQCLNKENTRGGAPSHIFREGEGGHLIVLFIWTEVTPSPFPTHSVKTKMLPSEEHVVLTKLPTQ